MRDTVREHIFGCFIEESSGLRSLDIIGEDNVMIETDYPHSDTTWPNSIGVARKLVAGLPVETQYKILRGNAREAVPLRANHTRIDSLSSAGACCSVWRPIPGWTVARRVRPASGDGSFREPDQPHRDHIRSTT